MVITIQCPECSTSFPVDPAKIPEGGVKVRCSTCSAIFRVEKPEEAAPPPPPPLPEPEPTFETPVFEAPPGEVPDRYASETDFSVGTGAMPEEAAPAGNDWVFEREEDIDPGSLSIGPAGTVQEPMEATRDESSFFGSDPDAETGAGVMGEAPVEEPEPVVEEAAPAVTGFTFGKRDPHDKAKRLARVLVSDIITYNPDRHQRALTNGTLREDFEDEIEKSWKEYVEQVGDDIAGSTNYWTEALNNVLARGQPLF